MSDAPEKTNAKSRRSFPFGQIIAVVAVVISALTLWNTWTERQERTAERVQKQQESARAAVERQAARSAYVLKGTVGDDGDELVLKPVSDEKAFLDLSISFPKAIGADPIEQSVDLRLLASSFGPKLRDTNPPITGRMPIVITARSFIEGAMREDTGVYDVGYQLESRVIGPREVKLTALTLVQRAKPAEAAALRDRLWAERTAVAKAP